MIRKLIITVIVANFLVMLAGVITSTTENMVLETIAQTEIPGYVHADVPEILELISLGIKKIPQNTTSTNPWDFTDAPGNNIEFGELVYKKALGALVGEYYYCAIMIPVSSKRAFKITETGSALLGPGVFPDNRYVLVPDYQAKDLKDPTNTTSTQGPMPATASLGVPTTAVGTHDVYRDTSGVSKIVRAFLSIPPQPSDSEYPYNYLRGYDLSGVGVGAKQPYTDWKKLEPGDATPGDYSGSITFTLSLT